MYYLGSLSVYNKGQAERLQNTQYICLSNNSTLPESEANHPESAKNKV